VTYSSKRTDSPKSYGLCLATYHFRKSPTTYNPEARTKLRQTTLLRVRMRDTLAISPRGKAACDEIMHKDAAGDDRGPERHLVAESGD
jgi:hypothetical protein